MGGLRWLKTVSIAKASAASLLGSIFALFPFIPDVGREHSSKTMAVSLCAKPEQTCHAFGDHPATEDSNPVSRQAPRPKLYDTKDTMYDTHDTGLVELTRTDLTFVTRTTLSSRSFLSRFLCRSSLFLRPSSHSGPRVYSF